KQKFDGDAAPELRVRGLIDVCHAARSQMRHNFVLSKLCADYMVWNKIWTRILSNKRMSFSELKLGVKSEEKNLSVRNTPRCRISATSGDSPKSLVRHTDI